MQDPLIIAGREYGSACWIGTGKYRDFAQTAEALDASGAEIVTVAIRRVNLGQNPDRAQPARRPARGRYALLPNTAGCYTADDAVRTLRLARELLDDHRLVKLEVLGDPTSLFRTLPGAESRRNAGEEGFDVMVYTSDDPIVARQLEEHRLLRHHAAGQPDRLGHGHSQPVEPATDSGAKQGAGAGGCRRGHRQRCRHRHGLGCQGRADEHRHCRRADPDSWPTPCAWALKPAAGLSGRAHAEKALPGSPSSPSAGLITAGK